MCYINLCNNDIVSKYFCEIHDNYNYINCVTCNNEFYNLDGFFVYKDYKCYNCKTKEHNKKYKLCCIKKCCNFSKFKICETCCESMMIDTYCKICFNKKNTKNSVCNCCMMKISKYLSSLKLKDLKSFVKNFLFIENSMKKNEIMQKAIFFFQRV